MYRGISEVLAIYGHCGFTPMSDDDPIILGQAEPSDHNNESRKVRGYMEIMNRYYAECRKRYLEGMDPCTREWFDMRVDEILARIQKEEMTEHVS
jgi:hypothetical protein